MSWAERTAREKETPRSAPAPRKMGGRDFNRARSYVAKMPAAISGQGGHQATWNVARKCAADFGLSEADTLELLREFNARCEPPWTDRELEHKARDATSKARISNPIEDRHWQMPTEHYERGNGRAEYESEPHQGMVEEEPTAAEPTHEPLAERWVKLCDAPELLTDQPPRQVWLLDRCDGGRSVGVLPRGRTGLVTGTGGTGKTYTLMQLAIAAALGGFWLNTFRVATPGHVLLALGEEDLDEAHRRLWKACNAAELSAEQRRDVAQRIDLLPLAGVSVALTYSPAPGVIVATEIAAELRRLLERRGVDWALIVIDPLSRWAGGGIEADNEAATRFVQVIETLTTVQGSPSVLVSHHSSKTSAQAGTSDARGVTGIRDGFRWMVSLDAVKDENGRRGIRMSNRKSNYSPEFDDVMLVRNDEPGIEGTLRLAAEGEAADLAKQPGTKEVTDEALRDRVLETVRRHPNLKTASQVAELTVGTKSKVLAAVKTLRFAGRLVFSGGSFVVSQSEEPNQ